jgi:hypothetical protein
MQGAQPYHFEEKGIRKKVGERDREIMHALRENSGVHDSTQTWEEMRSGGLIELLTALRMSMRILTFSRC